MKSVFFINIIPRNRYYYAFLGLILASLLFSTTATTLIGVYSYIETYLGDSDDVMLLTEEGSGRTIATSYIDLQLARSASYIEGVLVSSPETITPCMINGQVFIVRGTDTEQLAEIDNYVILDGQNLKTSDINKALIGKRVAQKLQLIVGSRFIVFSSLRDITLELEVIGIYESSNDLLNDEILVPLSVGQWISGHYPSRCTFIRIKFLPNVISKETLQNIIMKKHTLTLNIYDSVNLDPIQNAAINIYDINKKLIKSDYTDSLGQFNFDLLMGNYTINMSYNGVKTSRSIFILEDVSLSIYLTMNYSIYKLRVNLYNDSGPVIKRTISIWQNSEIICMGQSNLSGCMCVLLPQGEYKISTYYWNPFSKTQIEFNQFINLNTNLSINFYFKNYSLSIYTLDPITKKLVDSLVMIKSINGTLIQSGNTGSDGYIHFSNLLPDYYNITVISGESKKFRLIMLKTDLTLHFSILPYFKLTIFVMNYSNSNPMDANITIINLENNESIKNNTGVDGEISLFLESKTYKVIYEILNYSNFEIINLNNTINHTFWIPPYSSLIQIINFNNSFISNANVTISRNEFKISGITNATGEIKFMLYPNTYNMTINYTNKIYSTSFEIINTYKKLLIMIPPYNFTINIYNGTIQEKTPVENISVKIYNRSSLELIFNGTSDAAGRISCLLDSGGYNLTIYVNNSPYSKLFDISNNNTYTNFYTPPYNLTINITSAINAMPIENATIKVYKLPENQEIFSENSSTKGIVNVLLKNSGYYRIVTKYFENTLNRTIFINEDPVIDFSIPPYNITFFITDINGPIENANVSISTGESNLTNADGLVWFILDQGMYNISTKFGNLTKLIQLNLTGLNPTTFIEIQVFKRYKLNITVVESISGKPIENVYVKILYNNTLIDDDTTDENGKSVFELDTNVGLLYNISIKYNDVQQFRFLNLTSDTCLNFSIIKTNLIKIKVLDGFDNPLPYSKILVVSTNKFINKEFYTDSSGISLIYLEPESYNITVSKNEFIKSDILDIWEDKSLSYYLPPYKLDVFIKNESDNAIYGALVQISSDNNTLLTYNYTNINGHAIFQVYESVYKITVIYKSKTWVKNIETYNTNSSIDISFIICENPGSNYIITNPLEYSSSLLEQTFGLTESMIYILTIIITLLVSLSIMNVVSSSLNESHQNIGMLKALGANSYQIFIMTGFKILLISLIAGIIGGILGGLLGGIISLIGFQLYLIEIFNLISFFQLIGYSIIMNLIITSFSSIYTLIKLNKIPTAEALKEILVSK
ncbi:MAG: FtsX-like permease family protein [Candidatus Helarchaeota archaeon]